MADNLADPVTFGSVAETGYVVETHNDGQQYKYVLNFDREKGSWGFESADHDKVWYYEQFAWGNAAQTWYLRHDYHDIYTQVDGFWPYSLRS